MLRDQVPQQYRLFKLKKKKEKERKTVYHVSEIVVSIIYADSRAQAPFRIVIKNGFGIFHGLTW